MHFFFQKFPLQTVQQRTNKIHVKKKPKIKEYKNRQYVSDKRDRNVNTEIQIPETPKEMQTISTNA